MESFSEDEDIASKGREKLRAIAKRRSLAKLFRELEKEQREEIVKKVEERLKKGILPGSLNRLLWLIEELLIVEALPQVLCFYNERKENETTYSAAKVEKVLKRLLKEGQAMKFINPFSEKSPTFNSLLFFLSHLC